jgi:hypothetical protein
MLPVTGRQLPGRLNFIDDNSGSPATGTWYLATKPARFRKL